MSIRFEKLTVKAQEAVQRAQKLAEDKGHSQLTSLHLLKALLDEEQGVVRPIVQKIGASPDQLRATTVQDLNRLPKVSGGGGMQVGLGQELLRVFDAAQKQADQMKDQFLSTEHLLIGLVKVDSEAKKILNLNGVGEHDVLEALKSIRGGQTINDQSPEEKYQALKQYGIDLV